MNEIVAATKYGGITRDALNAKWTRSCKNDYDGAPITDRTFYRIINDLEELFACEILCSTVSKKYSLRTYDSVSDNRELTLLDILSQKAKASSINQILQMLVSGNDLQDDDMRAARDLAAAVSKLPKQYADDFLKDAAKIPGADMAEEDEYYPNYVCVWNEAVYRRTWQWLSIGFYDNDVYFYVVSEESDPTERSRKAAEAGFGGGIRYKGGYYWYKPKDLALFSIHFDTKPDMAEVAKRTEYLLALLEKVQPNEKNNED